MRSLSHLFLIVFFILSGCTSPAPEQTEKTDSEESVIQGLYFGETAKEKPVIFGKGLVSRETQELNCAFSPDGREVFFTLSNNFRTHYVLCHMTMNEDDTWGKPKVASFAGRYSDADPIFSPDGQRLYFISKRPYEGEEERDNFDIWFVEKSSVGWGDPQPVPGNINDEFNQYYVSLSENNNLYYASRKDKEEKFGIFKAELKDGEYVAERMGSPINSDGGEGDVFIAPDESYMIFVSRREGTLGSGDLYISFNNNEQWSEPQNLGPEINSPYFDYCPIVSNDGKYFFFTSYKQKTLGPTAEPKTIEAVEEMISGYQNGMGNVYWMKADFIEDMKATAE
jgi:hypothetical protein